LENTERGDNNEIRWRLFFVRMQSIGSSIRDFMHTIRMYFTCRVLINLPVLILLILVILVVYLVDAIMGYRAPEFGDKKW
jgi:cytochrome c oxidase subunit IV